MNADRLIPHIVSAFILILLWTLSACAPTASPTLFRPPSGLASPTPTLPDISTAAATPIAFSTETSSPFPIKSPTLAPPTPIPPCTNNLTFLLDLTYIDNTTVSPNQALDKQWFVQNSGTCDWDASYHLVWIGGDLLGAPEEIPLYPARAGAQVIIRIIYVSPSTAGTYQSQWQAEGPDGTKFGDTLFIQIIVNQ